MSNDARKRFLAEMQSEAGTTDYLGRYLAHLRSFKDGVDVAESLHADLIETFTTDAGLRTLKLMEKAVLIHALEAGASDSALRENNAVRRFVLEIRRLASQ